MPSATHETLIDLFRERPDLAPTVLQAVTGLVLPPGARIRASATQFTDLAPPEYRADLVVRIESRRGRLLRMVVIEAQLTPDERKRLSWPAYVVNERARLRCPVTLMVVTLTRRMERWCARRIPLDDIGNGFQPLVIGPSSIPRITDLAAGRANPALAVLSATAHGKEHGAEHIALAAFAGCATLDNHRAALYADLVMAHLGQAARSTLEALMQHQRYEYQSDFAKKYFQQGREEGVLQGREEGQQAMLAMLTRLLEQRFGALPAATQAALARADADQLLRWGERVLTAASLDDVFAAT